MPARATDSHQRWESDASLVWGKQFTGLEGLLSLSICSSHRQGLGCSSSPHRQGLACSSSPLHLPIDKGWVALHLPIDKGCSPSTSCSPSIVKAWNLTNCKLRCTLAGHGGYVNTVAVSPDGSLCASGGKDGVTLLWDLAEGKKLYSLDAGAIIHALCFSPNRYWLCAATQDSVKIWDLEGKTIVQELKPEATPGKNQMNKCWFPGTINTGRDH